MIRSFSSSRCATRGERPRRALGREHRAFALITVLYCVVVTGLLAAAVLAATRRLAPASDRVEMDAKLVAAAETAVYGELADWDAGARARQRVGTTVTRAVVATASIRDVAIYVTRLSARVYSLVGEAVARQGAIARRVNLLVRVPLPSPSLRGALVSAGSVLLGQDVRVIADSTDCGSEQPAAVLLAPGHALLATDVGTAIPPPAVIESAVAADSLTYARIAGESWEDLIARADVKLAPDARITPSPEVSDGVCVESFANWGAPGPAQPPHPCERRTVLVHAAGDLTIDGGRGQGILLVNGRLRFAGPFVFSGQIVAHGGIESLSDGVELSGIVMSAAREQDGDASHGDDTPVSLRHRVTLRASGCDAQHGVASWLQPRVVRERAWAELF